MDERGRPFGSPAGELVQRGCEIPSVSKVGFGDSAGQRKLPNGVFLSRSVYNGV